MSSTTRRVIAENMKWNFQAPNGALSPQSYHELLSLAMTKAVDSVTNESLNSGTGDNYLYYQ